MIVFPQDIDWTAQTDQEVFLSWQSGIPGAAEEAHKRGLDEPMPKPSNVENIDIASGNTTPPLYGLGQ